jgi:hypothetical protein
MRKSEDTIYREDSIMDKQIVEINAKIRYARNISDYNVKLNQLESIYRNLGKALDIINTIK